MIGDVGVNEELEKSYDKILVIGGFG